MASNKHLLVLSRRDMLLTGAGLVTLAGIAACKSTPKELACTDTAGLAPADAQTRTTLQYADKSTQVGKSCSNCQQFEPAGEGQCGKCKVVKGPINPGGYCTAFVVKT
jgi:High potential iron-sulfur protein